MTARRPTDAPAERGGLQFLDGLRGLAALYVMAGHARWLLWEGFGEFQKHRADYSALGRVLVYFFSLFRWGHEAVLFFFVLSGFVIHLRYARRLVRDPGAGFDWGPFAWRRARRLYPPLLAAMALSFALDSLGRAWGLPIYTRATPYDLINQSIAVHLDPVAALGNACFLMQTYVPVFGCNGPLWSLKFEWWFYMVYPVFFLLGRRSIWLATGVMAALFAAAHSAMPWPLRLAHDVFGSMLAWWLGALLAEVFAGRLRWAWHWVAPGSLALAAASSRLGLDDLRMAFVFTALLAGGFMVERWHVHLGFLERLKPLGDMSYTLYVTHFPILVLGSACLMQWHGGTLPMHFGWVAFGMLVTLLFACALHFAVERPFLSRK